VPAAGGCSKSLSWAGQLDAHPAIAGAKTCVRRSMGRKLSYYSTGGMTPSLWPIAL
jgi:hypothetical protein